MNTPTLHDGPPSQPRIARGRGVWCAAGLVAAAGVWCGCAVTVENYRALSFFFDGVPDPGLAVARAADGTVAPAVIVHAPFAEEKCESCHRTQYRPGRNDPTACLSCHEKAREHEGWTHGAVAGGACLWCHAPHESARRWLLRGPDRKVCAQCRAASMTAASPVAAHADESVGCLACHFGHGGPNPMMLRAGITASSAPPTDTPDPGQGRSE